MTAPVLSPVRWWRDDATRYVTRGLQIVPAAATTDVTAWAFELIAGPVDPAIHRWLDAEIAEWFAAYGVPVALLDALGSGGMSGTGVALAEYRRRLGLPERTACEGT